MHRFFVAEHDDGGSLALVDSYPGVPHVTLHAAPVGGDELHPIGRLNPQAHQGRRGQDSEERACVHQCIYALEILCVQIAYLYVLVKAAHCGLASPLRRLLVHSTMWAGTMQTGLRIIEN